MPQGECPFCELIASGDVMQVYENESVIAFLDINPRAEGHTIIAPKEHAGSLADLPPGTVADVMEAVQAVAQKVQSALDAGGVSILANDGETAGQRVPHFYVQLFPRYAEEENAGVPAGAVFQPIEMDENDLATLADELASVSTGGEEESAGETAADQVRSGTNFGRSLLMEDVSQATEESEESQASPEDPAQEQRPPAEEAGEARFTTKEEVEEEYPDMDNIKVRSGIDLDKYEPQELEIDAHIHQDYTEVEFREHGYETKFSVGSTHERDVVEHIARHFDLDPEIVADRIAFHYKRFDERSLVPRSGYEDYSGSEPEEGSPVTPTKNESETEHDRAEFI